jgi:hypothetical protein
VSIDYSDVFPVLANALPEFSPSSEDWEDCLSYPFLNEMVRFVCDRAYLGIPEYEPLMQQFAALFERLISEGDSNVHDLAHDALETVWEHREERDLIAAHFGPKTRELWERIYGGERDSA